MDQELSSATALSNISAWPPGERPRERLLERGAQALSDAELLALVFGTGSAGINALDMARQLLQHFDSSLRRLLSADAATLLQLRGLGPARYATLMAALELARRHYREALHAGPAMNAPASTRQFLTAQLRDRPYEVFCCLHLDNRHRLIHFEEVFRGTIDGASVHPREVVRQALRYNAAALIFAHNHPSGVAEASQADELITRRLRDLWVARHYSGNAQEGLMRRFGQQPSNPRDSAIFLVISCALSPLCSKMNRPPKLFAFPELLLDGRHTDIGDSAQVWLPH